MFWYEVVFKLCNDMIINLRVLQTWHALSCEALDDHLPNKHG